MPISRTATLLASTAITFAFPFAAKAAVETCTNTAGVQSETTDFGDTAGTATALLSDTFLVCGSYDGPLSGTDLDFITFTDLNAGQSFFDVNYGFNWADGGDIYFGDGPDAGSITTGFVVGNLGSISGGGSFIVDTGESFAGGSYTLAFDMTVFYEGGPAGVTSYSIRLREAAPPEPPVNPVPLPASAMLLGAGLAGFGAAGARKKAKRRG